MRTLSNDELNHVSIFGAGLSTFDKILIGTFAGAFAVGALGIEITILYQSGTFSLFNGVCLVMTGVLSAGIGASIVVGFSGAVEGFRGLI